ncbi:unnamed protein product [Clonostachys solani]|uniref:Uncharacterized protein n=1 Tax=Clonostachys solani TaxID=160281 RepID=A0A9N9YVG5_9HYPO|nr:unnamed protein product [Clonostachys solani]
MVEAAVEIPGLRGYRDPPGLYLVTARGVATMNASLNPAVNLSNNTPSPSADHRIVAVDGDFLPYPATKLVVTQYLEASSDPPFWALIVVGAFFDQYGNTLWSTELFVAHLDIQLESDDSSEGESVWESSSGESADLSGRLYFYPCSFTRGPEDGMYFALRVMPMNLNTDFYIEDSTSEFEAPTATVAEPFRYSAPRIDNQSGPSAVPFHPPQVWAFPPNPQSLALTGSLGYWDPTSYGPAPGHWLASFDHTLVGTMSGGWNPVTGRDAMGSGQRPPLAPFGAPVPVNGEAYIPHMGAGPGQAVFSNVWTYGGVGSLTPAVQYAGVWRPPHAYPNIDPHMPAAQMTNSTGGVGCEPGYNFFFPAETTKCHIFYSETPPWQLPANASVSFKAAHIPCNTLLGELLKGFGCTNDVPKKNRCVEVVAGGNGKWYRGISFSGADKDMLKKTIRDVGWDKTRSGRDGEKPVVCLWFCKN